MGEEATCGFTTFQIWNWLQLCDVLFNSPSETDDYPQFKECGLPKRNISGAHVYICLGSANSSGCGMVNTETCRGGYGE